MNIQAARRTSALSSGWLVGLSLVTFAIGTDDFVIAGALPSLSSGLKVPESAAGQLVTAFSITYAVAAPIMAVATRRLPRKRLVVGGLATFVVINLATAVAPSFGIVLVLRVLAALVASTVSPVAFALAGSRTATGRAGRAIGIVASGLTASLVIGVPAGSWLSHLFGWRSTFVAVGCFTGLALVVTGVTLPAFSVPPVTVRVRARLSMPRGPALLTCVAATMVGACAGLMTYTYIAPITQAITGTGGRYLAVFIATVGIAGAAGTFLGGRLTDRWGADRTMLATFATVVMTTLVLSAVGRVMHSAPVWLVAVLLAVWGLAAWGNNPPMNARMLALAGDAGTEAIALNTSGLYLGVALAGAIGGLALRQHQAEGVLLAATTVGLIAIVIMTVAVRRWPAGR